MSVPGVPGIKKKKNFKNIYGLDRPDNLKPKLMEIISGEFHFSPLR